MNVGRVVFFFLFLFLVLYLNFNRIYLNVDFIIPQRVVLALMGFLAILNAYTMRISLSIAITQLVVRRNHAENGEGQSVCQADDLDNGTPVSKTLWGQIY